MQTQFKLDTSRFADCANSAKTLAEKLEDAILDCDRAIDSLYIDWMGKTRNEFEKSIKYLNNKSQILKMDCGNYMKILFQQKKVIFRQIQTWLKKWKA